jgi:hypothetical protein
MNKNKFFIALFATILCVTFVTPSAWAGKKQRYRWEGVAMGLGAAILGNAIYNNQDFGPSPSHAYCSPPPARRDGHWEIRKVRVRPSYQRVWNEGHYNRSGRWVRGHWTRIVREPGYSFEKRVWVNHGYHRSSSFDFYE